MGQWTESINQIKNPVTGQSLAQEQRILELQEQDQKITLKYVRDGLDNGQKRAIEDEMYQILLQSFEEDNITILSVSQKSEPSEDKPKAPQASLKTGHGPVGAQKRRVPGVQKVIAVSSCKGGVGKSTVAVNLSLALKNKGYKVGILDADIYGPSVPMLLGQRDAKPMATEQKKMIPIEAYGLFFMSFGLFINESDPVIWRGPMLGGVLNQFLFDVDWGELDFLIIDLPPGTGDMQLSMIQATEVDGAVIVSTPQNVALLDAKKGMAMFKQVNVPIVGMIENMSYFTPDDDLSKTYHIFGHGGVKQACEDQGISFLGEVPLEMALREGSDEGTPYMSQEKLKGRPVWNAFEHIGQGLIEYSFGKQKKGFFDRFF